MRSRLRMESTSRQHNTFVQLMGRQKETGRSLLAQTLLSQRFVFRHLRVDVQRLIINRLSGIDTRQLALQKVLLYPPNQSSSVKSPTLTTWSTDPGPRKNFKKNLQSPALWSTSLFQSSVIASITLLKKQRHKARRRRSRLSKRNSRH